MRSDPLKNYLLLVCSIVIMGSLSGQENLPSDTNYTHEWYLITSLEFQGNKVTRERIINRELLFHPGDTIAGADIAEVFAQSRKNLMNTSLFNFVTILSTADSTNDQHLAMTIEFLERWYIWPVPILEFADRNFNEWLKKRDVDRLNYGMFLTWNNFRGRREKLMVFTRFGYDEKYEIGYQVPYVNKSQTLGIGVAGGFNQNHEISYNSDDNKEVYLKSEDAYPKRETFAFAEAYYRKGIHNKHWFKLKYTDLKISDSVRIYNPNYMFGENLRNRFFTFYYQFRSDFRDYTQYPLRGYYFDVEVDKKGLGIMTGPKVNTLFLKTNFRKYGELSKRWFWASGATFKVSPFWKQPYYYMSGMGYGRDFVRGFEYYVIDGLHYGILKNNLKFELIPQTVQEFKFIPSDKFNKLFYAFYLNAYVDVGYTFSQGNNFNPLGNEWMMGYGVGLDFVTYYDFVLRMEYSFNSLGESGFFIHFMPSI